MVNFVSPRLFTRFGNRSARDTCVLLLVYFAAAFNFTTAVSRGSDIEHLLDAPFYPVVWCVTLFYLAVRLVTIAPTDATDFLDILVFGSQSMIIGGENLARPEQHGARLGYTFVLFLNVAVTCIHRAYFRLGDTSFIERALDDREADLTAMVHTVIAEYEKSKSAASSSSHSRN